MYLNILLFALFAVVLGLTVTLDVFKLIYHSLYFFYCLGLTVTLDVFKSN